MLFGNSRDFEILEMKQNTSCI